MRGLLVAVVLMAAMTACSEDKPTPYVEPTYPTISYDEATFPGFWPYKPSSLLITCDGGSDSDSAYADVDGVQYAMSGDDVLYTTTRGFQHSYDLLKPGVSGMKEIPFSDHVGADCAAAFTAAGL